MRHSTAASLLAKVQIWRKTPSKSPAKTITSLTLAGALLGACSIATPPVVTTQGGQLSADQTISLAQPSEDSRSATLYTALGQAFANHGFSLTDGADHTVEYSITERPASVGIAHEGVAEQSRGPEIVSEDRKDRSILRECNAKRLRINLVAYPKQTDGTVKRAAGDMDDCGFTADSVDALVAAMVAKIVSN